MTFKNACLGCRAQICPSAVERGSVPRRTVQRLISRVSLTGRRRVLHACRGGLTTDYRVVARVRPLLSPWVRHVQRVARGSHAVRNAGSLDERPVPKMSGAQDHKEGRLS